MKANLLTLGIVILMLAMLAVYFFNMPEVEWTTAKIVGAAIAGISFPLFVLARLQLGDSFSVRAKAKALVKTGLYSRIRNPIYLFGGLFMVGLALFLSAWWLLLAVLVIAPVQVYRVRQEARVLTATFGDEYLRYKARTWF